MKQVAINIYKTAGSFAEDKDQARDVRLKQIIPALENKQEVILDFAHVEGATQSFIHALISDLIRNYGSEVLDQIAFKDCNETIRKIISIVVDYMQQGD